MRLALVTCCGFGLMASAIASAQPAQAPQGSYGDRQAGHFGDPGAGYFGNTGSGDYTNQSLDSVRAKAAEQNRLYGRNRRGSAPSPYVVLEQPAKPKTDAKTPAAPAAPPT